MTNLGGAESTRYEGGRATLHKRIAYHLHVIKPLFYKVTHEIVLYLLLFKVSPVVLPSMLRPIAYFLVMISLLTSPVIAGFCELQSASNPDMVVAEAYQGKAKEGDSKLASNHHCFCSHTQYGDCSPTYSHIPSSLPKNHRLPLLADEFLVGFGPNPLLEPPAHA